MMFVELALQGIRGFPRLHKVALRPGLNVARTDDPARRRQLFDLLYHTVYPDPVRAEATAALADPGASQSRIALTFYGRDKQGYRIIRDTVTGATKLYRYDTQEKKYRLFSEVSSEVAQFVRVQQQLPDEVAYERLFVFDPEQQPSRRQSARTRSGAPLASGEGSGAAAVAGHPSGPYQQRAPSTREPPAGGGFGGPMNINNALVRSELEGSDPASPELSEKDKRAQLDRLKLDFKIVVRAEAAQIELDRIQARRTEIARVAEQLHGLQERASQLELHVNPAFVDLPDGLAEKLRTYESREKKYSAEHHRLTEERARLLADAELEQSLSQDRYFLIGVGGAAACLVAAVLLRHVGLALANVPFAMVAVGAGFRWVADLEQRHRLEVKAAGIEKQLERLTRNHELDVAAPQKLMKVLGKTDAADLIQELDVEQAKINALSRVKARIARLKKDPKISQADRELERLDAAARKLDREIVGASGSAAGAEQIRRRIRVLEKELNVRPSELPAVPDPLMGAPDGGFSDGVQVETGDVFDPLESMENSVVSYIQASTTDSLPPMPAPGEAIPPTPDIPPAPRLRPRETSVPGVVAHRSSTLDLPAGGRASSTPPMSMNDTWTSSDLPQLLEESEDTGSSGSARPSATTPASPSRIPSRSGSRVSRTPSRVGPAPTGAHRAPSVIEGTPTSPPPSRPSARGSSGVYRAPTRRVPSVMGPPPAAPSPPPSPRKDAGPFDFSGGYLTIDDEDEGYESTESGYDSGYGPGRDGSGNGGGATSAGAANQSPSWLCVGGGWGYGSQPPAGRHYGGPGGGDDPPLAPDRSRDLVVAATDLLQVQTDVLDELLAQRLGQYLMAFTDKRLRRAQFGPRGEVLLAGKTGDFVAYPDLEDDLVDLADASIKMALVEMVIRQFRIPVLLDDPFVDFPKARRTLVGQMLAYLSSATQVIIATPVQDLQGHVVTLDR